MSQFIMTDTRDVRHVLFDMLAVQTLNRFEKFTGHDRTLYEDTLTLAEKIARERLYPVNATGDREGVKFDSANGDVTTPGGFKEAYRAMAEAGFIGVSAEAAFGGLSLPLSLSVACKEYFCAANASLTFYALLTGSAAQLVHSFGSKEQKDIYLEKMLSGQWGGTMCLTEPEAGSEVGNVKTRAVRREDGTYLISGRKIFISGGEHDLTENIIHMVLARIDGDPLGTRGLSLFIVPKNLPGLSGAAETRNDLVCTGVEHKMGIHGLSTCALSFGENNRCVGYLLGEERRGMRQMFQMMNEERLFVGLQGLAFSSAAYQQAVSYAAGRLQGVSAARMMDPKAPQIPIIDHPDVKRMLLWMKSYTEGMRMLTYYLGKNLDVAELDVGETGREARAMTELLTPLCKAGNSDTAWLVTSEAIQVFGGYGYCKDYPVEQYARDCKILSIVEGTNGIQSLDLLMRKVLMDKNGYNLTVFTRNVKETLARAEGVIDERYLASLRGALKSLGETVRALSGRMDKGDISGVFGQATLFQRAVFLLCLGWMHLWNLTACTEKIGQVQGGNSKDQKGNQGIYDGDGAFYRGKILSSRFFLGVEFPRCMPIFETILQDERALAETDAAIFQVD